MTEADAARIIRRHLWRGRTPPSPNGHPWHMGRELGIWRELVARGVDPRELAGAISVLRDVYPGARRLTCLIRRESGPALLSQAIARWHKLQAPWSPQRRREGLFRVGDLLQSLDNPPPNRSANR